MALSLTALVVTLGDVSGYQMSLIACLDVVAYLTSYFVRLRIMTRLAKSEAQHAARRYFVEEQMVASPALLLALGLLAIVGGDSLVEVRRGFTTFLANPALTAALLVGLCYAILCVFTTFIFLDRHENTFCIPMHCCSSMLSGVVASYVLAYFCDMAPSTLCQLVGSGILILAVLCLSFPVLQVPWRAQTARAHADLQRLFLFVCSGNTSRSPMAQAFCNDEVARRLGLSLDGAGNRGLRAVSAGLTPRPGSPLSAPAAATLRRLGVAPHAHASLEVTADLVHQAAVVFCMTEAQRRELIERFPGASGKLHLLDPEGDIDDPSGQDENAFMAMGALLQRLVRNRIAEFAA